MKNKLYVLMAVACIVCGPATQAEEPETSVTVGVELLNAYINHGRTYGSDLVLQPYASLAYNAWSFEFWGNYDLTDYNGNVNDNEFQELDVGLTYTLPVESAKGTVEFYVWSYPGFELESDKVIVTRWSKGVNVVDVGLYAEYYVDGGNTDDYYFEPSISWGTPLNDDVRLDLKAESGYTHFDEKDMDGWMFWAAKATVSYKSYYASLKYFGQIDEDVLPDGEFGAYDEDLVWTLGKFLTF